MAPTHQGPQRAGNGLQRGRGQRVEPENHRGKEGALPVKYYTVSKDSGMRTNSPTGREPDDTGTEEQEAKNR